MGKHAWYGFLLVGCLLAGAPAARAGEGAELNFLGFSKDGKFLAFEQYGTSDGKGAPYAEIFFIDVARNAYAAKPLKSDDAVPAEAALDTVREALLVTARPKLKELGIEADRQGRHLIAHGLHDLGADPRQVEFSPQLPLGGLAYDRYQVALEETAVDNDCFGFGKAKVFTLKLAWGGGKHELVLQKDGKLPESRGCPLGYRIQDVYLYEEKFLAVFLNMFLPGFEGQNMRYLAVTGALPEIKGGDQIKGEGGGDAPSGALPEIKGSGQP